MSSCFVCCEKFNKTTRSEIICPNDKCNFSACKNCIRQYLLSQKESHCMSCKQGWNDRFIISQTNKSFFDNDFMRSRKQFLLDSEISKIPQYMEAAENHKLIQEEEKNIEKIDIDIKKLNNELKKLKLTRQEYYQNICNLKNSKGKSERKKFIMPCPHNGCKGFLSQQYKCEICKLYTCPNCYEIVGHNKTDHHICEKTNIESAELIKKETKPCPNCGVRIFKISGCDQMWCTECETTFSWTTGRLLLNVEIHNPHFYARQRQLDNGNINRNPRDILCGGICNFNQLRKFIIKFINGNEILFKELTNLSPEDISEWHRFIVHITNIQLIGTRTKLQRLQNNQEIIIEYILNQRTKESLATHIFRNDKTSKKLVELINIFEILSVYGIESFGYLTSNNFKGKKIDEIFKTISKYYNEYQELIAYCNEQLKIISLTYNCQVIQIYKDIPRIQENPVLVNNKIISTSYNFRIKNEKFTIKDYKNNSKITKELPSCSYH